MFERVSFRSFEIYLEAGYIEQFNIQIELYES